MRILILKTSALGDIIHALPVLDYLHQVAPGVRIDWVVEEAFLELLSGNPLIDRLITVSFKRWRKAPFAPRTLREIGVFRKRIQEREYDLVFDIQGNFKSGLVCWLANSKRKIGFSRDKITVANCIDEKADPVPSLFQYAVSQGANPNLVDDEGQTALFEIYDPDAVDELAKHGADMNHLNKEGQSAVFGAWDEASIIRKMDLGTKPVGKYYKTNFWDYAQSRKWPKVIAWLEAHPDVKKIAQGQ